LGALAIQYSVMDGDESKPDEERLEFTAEGETPRRARRMFRGWFLAGLGALITALGGTPLDRGLPVWNPVLRNVFGWTAGQMSWALAAIQAERGLLGPLAGLLVVKFGPRNMVFIGLTIFGLGFVLFSQIQQLWQLYVVVFIMSFGTNTSSWIPMQTVMNNWFVRYKARAMALVNEGGAIGGIVVPLLLAWAIGGADPDISERFGWRTSAFFIGILCIVVAFPLSRLVHNHPEDLGLGPDGDPVVPDAASPVDVRATHSKRDGEGYTWQEALRSKSFWLLSIGHGTSVIAVATLSVHLGLMMDDRGFSLQTIGTVLAVYTAVSAVFIPISGYLGDRLPMRRVAFGFAVLQALAVVMLITAHTTGMLYIFAALYGTGHGGRGPMMPALRGAYFKRNVFASVSGISMVPVNILAFIGPVFAGVMRDATGNYDVPILTIGAVSIFGSCLYLLLGEPPSRFARTARSSQAAD
jgi:MFS family permease